MRRLALSLLCAALLGSPLAAQVRATVRAPLAPVPSGVAAGVLGLFKASLRTGLGTPSLPTSLPELHIAAVRARTEGSPLAALSAQGHAKMAAVVQALGPKAEAREARLAPAQAKAVLSAIDRTLKDIPAEDLKDPVKARAALGLVWDGLKERPSSSDAVPGREVRGRHGLKPAEAPKKKLRLPLVTGALLAANAAVYAAPAMGWFDTEGWRLSLGTLAGAFESGGPLGLLQASGGFVTSVFAHADLGHLTHNLVGLAVLGTVVEAAWGHLKTFAVYGTAALAAGLVWAAANWGAHMASLGASAGVTGLAGVYLGFFILDYSKRKAAGWKDFLMLLATWAATLVLLQFAGDLWGVAAGWGAALGHPFSPLGNTNHLAHLVGFLTGLLAARFSFIPKPLRP